MVVTIAAISERRHNCRASICTVDSETQVDRTLLVPERNGRARSGPACELLHQSSKVVRVGVEESDGGLLGNPRPPPDWFCYTSGRS